MRDETLEDYLERNNLFLCRQLTDEEIITAVKEAFGDVMYETCDDQWWLLGIKTILRKAQEK